MKCVILAPNLRTGQMLRRLEDRIRDLCAKAVASQDSPELPEVFEQLRAALHEHSERLRKSTVDPQLVQRRTG